MIHIHPPADPAGIFDCWRTWRAVRRGGEPGLNWITCPICWGAGRFLEDHRWHTCTRCLGVQEIPQWA